MGKHDFAATEANAFANQIYLLGYTNKKIPPAIQSFRIGANYSDKITENEDGTLYSADVIMVDEYSTPKKPTKWIFHW